MGNGQRGIVCRNEEFIGGDAVPITCITCRRSGKWPRQDWAIHGAIRPNLMGGSSSLLIYHRYFGGEKEQSVVSTKAALHLGPACARVDDSVCRLRGTRDNVV